MTTIFQPGANANLSAFGNKGPNALESLGQLFENNYNNAATQQKQALQNAQLQNFQSEANARQDKAIADQSQQRILEESARTLGDIMAPTPPQAAGPNGPGAPGMSIADKLNDPVNRGRINTAMINSALRGGKPSADLAALIRSVTANSGVSDDVVARAAVGAGEKIEPNDAFSLGGQANIRAGNVANTIAINNAKPREDTFILPNGMPVSAPAVPASGKTLYDNVDNSTGPISALQDEVANAAGFAGANMYPETVQGRQDLSTFGTRFTNSLRTNGKFTEGERKDLSKNIAIKGGFLTSPEYLRQKMISVDNTMSDLEKKTEADMNDPYMSKTDRHAAAANLRNIREFRMQLGAQNASSNARGEDNQIPMPTGAAPAQASGGWSVEEVK